MESASDQLGVIQLDWVFDKALPPVTGTNRNSVLSRDALLSLCWGTNSGFAMQWQLNGTNLLNATNQCYEVTHVQRQDAGHYVILVSSKLGVTNYNMGSVEVESLPEIKIPPAPNLSIFRG